MTAEVTAVKVSFLRRLAEVNDVTVLALEFGYLHKTLVECKKRIEADGSNHTWINPAIDIALARSKGEGLENLLGIKRATDLVADTGRFEKYSEHD